MYLYPEKARSSLVRVLLVRTLFLVRLLLLWAPVSGVFAPSATPVYGVIASSATPVYGVIASNVAPVSNMKSKFT